MKHTVIYIDGMTCINCQSRIWNVLKLRPEITGITVSYEYSRAEFDYDPKKIGMKEIVKMIEDLGYQVIPAEQFRRKQLRQAAAEIFAIALLFVILQRFGILNHLAPDSLAETGMGYGMLFVIGLITSVHCIAMCGGINLSQTLQKQEANAEEISRSMFRNTFSYNMGRVVSYTVIGGFLGAVGGLAGIGDSLQASTVFQGSLKLLAGIIMVVMGVNMLGIFPGLRKLRIHIPFPGGKSLWKKRTPFLVGLCNGFMPCGPLQSMEIVALASGSWVAGAFSMFCFSLGTVPLMLGFGSLDTSEAENTESDAEKEETVVYETPAVENGEISINADTLTSNPMYINYDSNGTNIQLIAVKGSDGTPRLSLNTCQVCNPSPRAYFKEQNGRLVCQNCGNVFTTDSVGETTGGCNPMYIDYKNTDGKLTVSVADLDTYTDQFASWDGPVK